VPVEEARFYVGSVAAYLHAYPQQQAPFYKAAKCEVINFNKGDHVAPEFVLMLLGKS